MILRYFGTSPLRHLTRIVDKTKHDMMHIPESKWSAPDIQPAQSHSTQLFPPPDPALGLSKIKTGRPKGIFYYGTRGYFEAHVNEAREVLDKVQLALSQYFILDPKSLPWSPLTHQRYWISQKELMDEYGKFIPDQLYLDFVDVMDTFLHLRPLALSAGSDLTELVQEIDDTIKKSTSRSAPRNQVMPDANLDGEGHASLGDLFGVLDELGRSKTLGARKEARACVWMIKAKPVAEDETHVTKILINDVPLPHYFPAEERENVVLPLRVASVLGKYNIYAQTKGGGLTAQSHAIAMAIARSIVVHEHNKYVPLALAALLKRDIRVKERKKTNQPKARKKFTWVKR